MKNRACRFLVPLLLFPVLQVSVLAQNSKIADIPSPAGNGSSLTADFEKAPLSFEENRGQSDASVKFLSHGNGYSLFLTDSAAVMVLAKHENHAKIPGRNSVTGDVIRMELPGAQQNVRVSGADELPGKANYFVGNNPSKWRPGIPTYAKVRYENVYPGIDLVYYGKQRNLEYDFVVAPSANAAVLRLKFEGAERLSLTTSGDLTIEGKDGAIAFQKPVVYQVRDGRREPVAGRFQLVGGNSVRVALGSYDHTRTLVIDPVLAYSTYLGGSGPCLNESLSPAGTCDSANAIAVDSAGDAYVAGGTINADFPVTADAFQKVNNGMAYNNGYYVYNAFVTKFNPSGSTLVYSTYLGGTTNDEQQGTYSGDVATGIAVDASGDAYVTGYASSSNFPVTSNAYQKTNKIYATGFYSTPVGNNAFVTKLNATGSALIYSTYFGGSGAWTEDSDLFYGENPAGIAIDAAGYAYIVGSAGSADLPVTSNAFQKVNNAGGGAFNLFIAKFNTTGSALVYSTYLGGSGTNPGRRVDADTAGGIAIDSIGDAYVTGTAYSRDFPVTANAYQKVNNAPYDPLYGDGGSNAIITELNPTGSALVYSTYLGGSVTTIGGYAFDGGSSIAVNSKGNAYVAGSASSTDFPVTTNAFQKVNGGYNSFITELNSTGSALVYSTFLGGSGGDVANSIALDTFGSAYVTGTTGSTNFPVTADAFRKVNHGNDDAFISKLDPTGSSLLYSSYLGGNGGDVGNGIAVDWFGDAYIAGNTCSTDFPLAGKPFQTTNKHTGGCTAFVSKFIVNTVTTTKLTSNSNPGKVGTTSTFRASVTPNAGTTVPTGSVVFTLDGTPEVPVPLDGSGEATYSNSSLSAGRYTITATYEGNPSTAGSVASLGQLIIGNPARITVRAGNNQTGVVGTPFAMPLVAQVHDERGMPVPGTVVTFASSSDVSWSANPVLTDANGRASATVSYSTGGSKTVTASVEHVSTPATFVEIVTLTN